MERTLISKWLVAGLSALNCLSLAEANNGKPLSPNQQPFASLTWTRREGERKIGGRCSATAVSGTTSSSFAQTALLTAAHCLITASFTRRFISQHVGMVAKLKSRLNGRRKWSSEDLNTLAASSDVTEVVNSFLNELSLFVGYQSFHFTMVLENGPLVISLKETTLKIHPLHILALLTDQKGGADQAYDLALILPTWPRVVPSLLIAEKDNLDGPTRIGLYGFGEPWDGLLPSQGDYDGDGVSNRQDRCPLTPSLAAVDVQGCAPNDRRLAAEFRFGRHDRGYAMVAHGGIWFPFAMGNLDEPEAIELDTPNLQWQDFANATPGSGDSGSGLVIMEREKNGYRPSSVFGVYHGPLGPRYEEPRAQIGSRARYENLTNSVVQSWFRLLRN